MAGRADLETWAIGTACLWGRGKEKKKVQKGLKRISLEQFDMNSQLLELIASH